MNFLAIFQRARPVRHPAHPCLPALPVLQDHDGDADDNLHRGCGWFDSSHELQHGLCVREHATADTLAGELPLVNWLELHLAGWRAQIQV